MSDTTQTFQTEALLGTARQVRKEAKASEDEVTKLAGLSQIDNRALFQCKAIFPFDLFPDTVTVDRNKITVSKQFFFFTRSIQSIMIKDLMTVVVQETLLFATLQIVDRLFPQETIEVMHLRKDDARHIRWIIEGLQIGEKEKVDFSKIRNEDLIPRLEEIGKTKSV